jgi:hypothetical protein
MDAECLTAVVGGDSFLLMAQPSTDYCQQRITKLATLTNTLFSLISPDFTFNFK